MPLGPAGQCPQALIKFPLLAAGLLRDSHLHLQIQVTLPLPAETGQPLVPKPQHRVRLNPGGHFYFRLAAFQRFYFKSSSQNGIGNGQALLPPEIGTVTLETRVRPHPDHHIEIARDPTRLGARHAPSRHAQSGSVLHPHRDADRQAFGLLHLTAAATVRANLVDHFAAPMAGRTGADLPHRHVALLPGGYLLAAALAGRARPRRLAVGGSLSMTALAGRVASVAHRLLAAA